MLLLIIIHLDMHQFQLRKYDLVAILQFVCITLWHCQGYCCKLTTEQLKALTAEQLKALTDASWMYICHCSILHTIFFNVLLGFY